MRNSETTRFKKAIKVTEEHLDWIKANKVKKSAAGFLEEIINKYRSEDQNHKSIKKTSG